MRKTAFVLLAILASPAASTDLADFVGYTILAKKAVAGYIDDDGKKDDSFEGGEFGRIIVFDDDTYVRCQSYGYQYAYRRDAVILVNGSSAKMLIEGEEYDVSLR